MQVEYRYYVETYGGNRIKENQWNRLALMSEVRLKMYTFERLNSPWPTEAKMALCEMAETLDRYEKRDGKISENNDGYSASYETQKPLNEALYDIVSSHLINTGVLYLGVDG